MTNNYFKTGAALLASIFTISPAWSADSAEVPAEERERLAGMFESIAPENIKVSPIDGWYTIQKGSVVAYISEDGRYLLQGDLIDLDSKVNLSEQSRTDARRRTSAARRASTDAPASTSSRSGATSSAKRLSSSMPEGPRNRVRRGPVERKV